MKEVKMENKTIVVQEKTSKMEVLNLLMKRNKKNYNCIQQPHPLLQREKKKTVTNLSMESVKKETR
eukprot:7403183-Ditylum_brightwellii.AAC.1